MLPISACQVQSGNYRCSKAKGEEKANRNATARRLRATSEAQFTRREARGTLAELISARGGLAARRGRLQTKTNKGGLGRNETTFLYASDVILTLQNPLA